MLPLLLSGMLAKAGSSLLGGLANTINTGVNAHMDRVQDWKKFQAQQAQQLQMQQNQFQNNLEMQKNQFDQQKFMASNSVQMKMQDMEKAGINPLLSSAGAFSIGGSGPVPVNNQSTNKGNQPSNGQAPKIVNAKKLYILK